jgi:hypothetical protein
MRAAIAKVEKALASLNPSARKNALARSISRTTNGGMIEVLQHGLILPGRPGGADRQCRADYR